MDVTIVGVGAIGRQVAVMLAAAGFPRLRLIDPDVVEDINLGTQMWPERFLGAPKVLAAADLCRELCQETVVETAVRHFGREDMPKTRDSVVFCCVDSFTARRQIFAICQKLVGFFVDGRMGAEVFHTYAFVPGPAKDGAYRDTLIGEGREEPCTARSTGFTAAAVAAMMVEQLTLWLRGRDTFDGFTLNLATGDTRVVDFAKDAS